MLSNFKTKLQQSYSVWRLVHLRFIKKTIQIFICFVEYEKVTWGQYKISTTTNWDRYEFSLVEANSANIIAHTFFTSLSDWVMNQVSARIQKLGHNDIIANLVD